jgi:hypothetical protein
MAPSTQTIANPIKAPASTPPAESSTRTLRACRCGSTPHGAAQHLEADRER